MYENIKSRISTPEGASAFFPCLNGVRQGENLSPLLFSVYLNDLQAYLDRNHVKRVSWDVNNEHMLTYLKILVLLFADDTVIFATNKDDLQVALNVFEHYCDQWKHLTVNISKTKIMIFSGGRIPAHLHFISKVWKSKKLASTNI